MKEQHKTSLQQWLIQIISQPMSGLSADIVGVNMGEWIQTDENRNFCFLCLGGRLVYEHYCNESNSTPNFHVTKEELNNILPKHSGAYIESLAGYVVSGEKKYDTPLFFTNRWPRPWPYLYDLLNDPDLSCYNFFFDVVSSIDNRVNKYFESKSFIHPAVCYCLLDELSDSDNGTLQSLWRLEWHQQTFDEYKAEVISHFRERHSDNIRMLVDCYLKALAS